MNSSIVLKQSKPTTAWMLGALLLVVFAFVLYKERASVGQLVVMFGLGLLLLVYSISYEIRSNYDHKKHFILFGLTIFKVKLVDFQPDRIVVFPVISNGSQQWGPVAALTTENKGRYYLIRLFNGNRHLTVFRSTSLKKAKETGAVLSELLRARMEVRE